MGCQRRGRSCAGRKIAKQTKITFPVLIDEGQMVSEMYDLEAMPSTVVVDRDGIVRYIHRGYKPGDEAIYREVIKKIIRE